jgi:hypothetical protein
MVPKDRHCLPPLQRLSVYCACVVPLPGD